MQELMVGTNRLPPRRVTALGGGLMGLVMGVLISYGTYAVMLQGQRSDAANELAQVRSAMQSKIDALQAEGRRQAMSQTGAPTLYLARQTEANAMGVRKVLDQFPAFKTDPYKQLFVDLASLVDHQRAQARELITSLSDPQLEPAARCRASATALSGEALWSNDGVTLARDGWRGVSP